MNLIEIADDLKNLPDQYLMQEIQAPSGNFPTYLIVTELGRRKRMRDKVAKDMPTRTVAEELATPPQMPQGMPQGLMAMPQAQTELAAQDVMGTTPPEMMMPTQQMAGGGMVSFKQGGDVIRAFDGLPEEFFTTGVEQPSISRGKLTELMTLPELQQYNRTGVVPERLRSTIGTSLIDRGSFLGGLPLTREAPQFPAAVTPAAVAPAAAPRAAPGAAPAPAPGGAPVAMETITPVQPSAGIRDALTPYALSTIGAQAASDYAQANPDRLTPFLQENITKREGELGGRRDSNINEALIQAGLGMMGSRSPYFLQGVSEGGLSGLKLYREGAKDIRQSEDALRASQAKMIEAQMLMDERKFKAASDARKEAIELENYGLNRARTESAIALQNLNAQIAAKKAPYDIAESQARAEAYRTRGTKLQVPDPMLVNSVKRQALGVLRVTEDEYKNNPTKRTAVDKAVADALSEQGFSYPNVSIAPRQIEYPG